MKVLIADDDGLTRKLLEGTAEKWGYEVHAVADGIAAWEELKKADGPRLACGEGSVRLLEVQREGGRRQRGDEFARGARLAVGERWG